LTAFGEAHPFRALIPVSVLNEDGVEHVLTEIEAALPEREAQFGEDTLTDRPMTFFAREYIREQVMQRTRSEVPHAVAVTIERFEHKPKLCLISATIHVEKAGQGSILVGHGGQSIKAIGIGARERLEELIGTQVHLELFVRVSDRWKDAPRKLSELGYDHGGGRALSSLLSGKGETGPRRAGSVPGKKATKKASKRPSSSRPRAKTGNKPLPSKAKRKG
jgi:GTPase